VLFLSLTLRSNLAVTNSMPDQLFMYYTEDSLLVLSINLEKWGEGSLMLLRLARVIWEIG
jgi:hypothetical protein